VADDKYTDVLIVGAGPAGLMMAAQLLRHGVQPTIIDAKPGPDKQSKAIIVHARSLELFRQLGLADELLTQGQPCYGIQLQGHRQPLGTLDFSRLAATRTAFPFMHLVGQDKTEKLLLGRLTEKACPVTWESRLVSLTQDDRGATAELLHKGIRETWRCGWVIGADGQNSAVRDLLNISLERQRPDRTFFVADVEVCHAHSRMIRLFFPKRTFLAIFPLGATDCYRMMGPLPEKLEKAPRGPVGYAEIKRTVDDALGFELPVTRCLWIGRYVYRKGVVEQLARQRCFLVGDAAHVASPITGTGMNKGLQEATNLAWKLAGVVSGRLAPRVLHTYEQERMPVARTGERSFGIDAVSRIWPPKLMHMFLAKAIGHIGTDQRRLRRAFDRMAHLDVHYRLGPLAVHHAAGGRVRAGDRLPYLSVFDEKTKTQTDLHRWCEKAGFVLLILGTISQHHLHIIAQWMRQKYPREMHLYYLPYSVGNQQVFEVFEVAPTGTKSVLIRPDMHIGYINDMLNVSLIDTYMEEVVGWKPFGHLPENT